MIHIPSENINRNGYNRKSAIKLLTNLFKRKKFREQDGLKFIERTTISTMDQRRSEHSGVGVPRVPSTLSVTAVDIVMRSPSPAVSTLTLTPGRTRDIDQDMQALRLSRQDNPFLQVLASRESLVDSLEESESDDANLMSQEFPADLEVDPLTLPEIHQHMIRSPPPITWPKSPNFKVFRFPVRSSEDDSSQESLHRCGSKSPLRHVRAAYPGEVEVPGSSRASPRLRACPRLNSSGDSGFVPPRVGGEYEQRRLEMDPPQRRLYDLG